MEAEEIFELLDSYWFEHEIFTKKPSSSPHKTNPVLEIKNEVQEPKVSSLPSLHVRSLSDHALMMICKSYSTSFFSDHSLSQKLQTIHSGKEIIDEFACESVKQQEKKLDMAVNVKPKRKKKKKKKKKKSSKSLSDLEFEELKGFMDLGFVFSEEDKDSSLVYIIPGLQRLKGNRTEEAFVNDNNSKAIVSRPYLSEAWDVLDQRKVENSLTNWRIPSQQLGNDQVNMKDHLKFWAHTVASTVR